MRSNPVTQKTRLIEYLEIWQRVGVKPKTIYLWEQEGRLPKGIRITPRTMRWHEEDINQWLKWGCPTREEYERLVAATNSQLGVALPVAS